jgi:hypothetical protein
MTDVATRVAVGALTGVITGHEGRNLSEVRAHLSFVELLLAEASREAIRAEFGGLLSEEYMPSGDIALPPGENGPPAKTR